jgi:hypothetical protein
MAGVAARSKPIVITGCMVVWFFDHRIQTVTVHRCDAETKAFTKNNTLDCADLLPGFSIPVVDFFTI